MTSSELIAFPAHPLLIVEERLTQHQAEGITMPEDVPPDELALRILIAAELARRRPQWRVLPPLRRSTSRR